MGKHWQLQKAKARLSELLRRAQEEDLQEITLRGKSAAVLLSHEDYEKLRAHKPRFIDFMRNSPLAGLELDIGYDKTCIEL